MSMKIKNLVLALSFLFYTGSLLATNSDNDKLMLYIRDGKLKKANKLIAIEDINLNYKNNLGETALISAANLGYEGIVKSLIRNRANLDAKDHWEKTALITASVNWDLKIVTILVTNGADLDAKTIDGYTALMYAVKFISDVSSNNLHRLVKVAEILISNGADLEIRNKRGHTALMLVLKEKSKREKIKYVCRLHKNSHSKHLECFDEVIRLLIESKLDFYSIVNCNFDIECFFKNIPKRVIMTQMQIRHLEKLSGYSTIKKETNETRESRKIMDEIKSKEIISFEENSTKTSEAIYCYYQLPTDIIVEIISYTVADCRMKLLHSTLKNQNATR